MLNSKKRILVLAPHTDDGELGAGATISRWIDEGKEVFYAAFSSAEESVPEGLPKDILVKEVKEATKRLGISPDNLFVFRHKVRKLNYVRQEILEQMVQLNRTVQPDLILMPSLNDVHQDHQTVAQEAVRAFKKKSILGYELIWNNLSFNTTCFVELTVKNVRSKFEALQSYESQRFRDYMSEEFIFAHARTRGVQIGAEYAECFEVVRWLI